MQDQTNPSQNTGLNEIVETGRKFSEIIAELDAIIELTFTPPNIRVPLQAARDGLARRFRQSLALEQLRRELHAREAREKECLNDIAEGIYVLREQKEFTNVPCMRRDRGSLFMAILSYGEIKLFDASGAQIPRSRWHSFLRSAERVGDVTPITARNVDHAGERTPTLYD